MKRYSILLSVCLLLFTVSIGSAQEDCTAYFPMQEGAEFEITNYNKKGKVTGRAEHTVMKKTVTDEGTNMTVHALIFDQKDKEVTEMDYTVKCKPGSFEFEMGGFSMAQMQGMEMETKVEGDFLDIPANAMVGQKLKDGNMSIDINDMMSMTTVIKDRVVENKETIETPAGTFDCIVISSNSETKMMMTIRSSSKEWYSKDAGMVKSEYYDKNGNLEGYSLLTKLKK